MQVCLILRHLQFKLLTILVRQGAPDADYSPIKSSHLNAPPEGWALDRVQVTAGQYVTVATGFVRGKKHKPIHAKGEEDYILRLLELQRTSFVLCDVNTRKAWLTNGLNTLLHLVRSHLVHAENDELYQSVLTMKASDLRAEGGRSGPKAAFETLRCASNRTLQLHRKGEPSAKGEAERDSENYYSLEDLVKSIMHVLEQIVDHQSDFRFEQASVGYRVKASPWEQLEGFDYMDVAIGRRNVSSRAMRLLPDGRGWTHLTRALEAPTLFGKHFGEMLEPASTGTEQNSKGCSVCHWNDAMPPGRDLLAVQTEDLLKAGTKDGSRLNFPDELELDIPPVLFEPCTARCQDSDRIQKLQRASENVQSPPSASRTNAPTGLIAKALVRLKMNGGEIKDGQAEDQSSSSTSIPSDGAILLGMPQQSSESYSQLIRRHLKRPFGHSAQSLSYIDNSQVAKLSSETNDATTNDLGSESAYVQIENTPPSHPSFGTLHGPQLGDSASAASEPLNTDSHRRKRAKRRAEEGTGHRQK